VSGTIANIGLVILFVLVGSMFAAAEMSLVSLRDSQVRAMAARGRRGEAVARLAKDPNRFLAAVQVGVTLAGFLSASFGGATLSGDSPRCSRSSVSPRGGRPVALVLVTSRSPTSRWCWASWPPSGWPCNAPRASRWHSARRWTGSPRSPGR
jgi:putative hemolysin